MMMKLLPLVAAAVAEKRFLSAKASDTVMDATDNYLLFDADVDGDVWTDGVKALFQAGTETIPGLEDGQADITLHDAVKVTTDGTQADATDAQKKRRRQVKEDGTGLTFTGQDKVPSCANTFVKSENKAQTASAMTKDADAAFEFTFADADAKDTSKAVGFLYYYCNHATKCGSTLTSGTVYKVGTYTDVDGTNYKQKIQAAAGGDDIKAAAGDADADHLQMRWIEQVAKDAPATLQLCSTAKASGSRSAAFVAGIITWALLA